MTQRKKLPSLKGTSNKNLNQISIHLFGIPYSMKKKKKEPETVEKKRKKSYKEENYISI